MIQTLKELFFLLSKKQRKQLIALQLLIALMSILELLAIASIGPFMATVAKPEIINEYAQLKWIYSYFECSTNYDLLIILGSIVLFLLSLSALVSLITTWLLLNFGAYLGTELGTRLFAHYLNQNWLYHASNNTSMLITKISTETNRTTNQVIQHALLMSSRIVLVFFIAAGICLLNPMIAAMGVGIFTTGYIIIFKIIKSQLTYHGENISKFSFERFKALTEGLGGIKDTILLEKQQHFNKRFTRNSQNLARSEAITQTLAQAPRYLMEILAFGSAISLIIFLIVSESGGIETLLPIIAIYALAGLKLMPAMQNIFNSTAIIKANISAFNNIKHELQSTPPEFSAASSPPITLTHQLTLKDIKFTYPKKLIPALQSINLTIKANASTAFVGLSGSGKSTLVDLILGLITPDSGKIFADTTNLKDKLSQWKKNIGYVPQSIYLSDTSIAENIAFGVDINDIDQKKLQKALQLSQLEQLISELPNGTETTIGEQGVQLSGGQRQRIGIARALYSDPQILIFDEATSALDNITEKQISDAILQLSNNKTLIIIAHRLTTIEKCDTIYFMEQGRIIDSGNYNQLCQSNASFRKMAALNQPIE